MQVRSRTPSTSVARNIAVILLLAAPGWARPVSAADASGRVGAGAIHALVVDSDVAATLYASAVCDGPRSTSR